MVGEVWSALAGPTEVLDHVEVVGDGALPSVYRVTESAASTVAAAGAAIAEWVSIRNGSAPRVKVDRRLASMWFLSSLRPIGWQVPPVWHAVAGDYQAADTWIRLHANYPHHRRIALDVLGCPAERPAVAAAVSGWQAEQLENAIVAAGGCAAMLRSRADWMSHAQGASVSSEPLVHRESTDSGSALDWPRAPERPLIGVRVLDLTRVLAGPVATRFLAGFGADVLRIDPPEWEEPGIAPEMTVGKRCARLDLRSSSGREQLRELLRSADVFVHGYRADALDRLGFGLEELSRLRPGLVDVSLNAYGWSGPWCNRRGFDSLVQMSSGIAEAGMRASGRGAPFSLPVQALDHATGYIMAAAAVRGLSQRFTTGTGVRVRVSLARTAELLAVAGNGSLDAGLSSETPADLVSSVESTSWGSARRLVPPLSVERAVFHWTRPATTLGAATASWQ